MQEEQRRQFEKIRRGAGPVQNPVIDDLLRGHLDRRQFVQRDLMFGLAIPAVKYALAAAGEERGPVKATRRWAAATS
jgi:hypothetical protein